MKKRLAAAAMAGLMLLSLAGCGAGTQVTGADQEKTAEALCEALREGDFETAKTYYSSGMKKAVEEETLKTSYLQFDRMTGPLTGEVRLTSQIEQNDQFRSCFVTEERENGRLLVHVLINQKNGKVEGLHLNCEPYADLVSNTVFEEVPVTVGKDSAHPLEGLLALPKGVEKPPVVLLIAGSGPCDRNETLYLNTPMRDIAHALAEQGIASLRYDKRFAAYPELAADKAFLPTLEAEVLDDAASAIELLREDPRVDGNGIFVLGHSLGGSLTPYFAAEYPFLQGIISVAGTLRPLYELFYDQNQELGKKLLETADKKTAKTVEKQLAEIEEDIEVLRGDFTDVKDDEILMGMQASYQKSLKQYAGEQYIDTVALPVFVLQGGMDFQVFPETDLPKWQAALKDRDNAWTKVYPQLNHLMMPSDGQRNQQEYLTPGTVDKAVTDDIAAFIKAYH